MRGWLDKFRSPITKALPQGSVVAIQRLCECTTTNCSKTTKFRRNCYPSVRVAALACIWLGSASVLLNRTRVRLATLPLVYLALPPLDQRILRYTELHERYRSRAIAQRAASGVGLCALGGGGCRTEWATCPSEARSGTRLQAS